jgi:carbonic anhydrase
MSASSMTPYLQRNRDFSARGDHERVPEIPFVPFGQLYVITCIDPRVDPAAVLGAGLGEAIVARDVGGRVTPAVIQDLAWILHLHEQVTPDADWFEIAIIHHTECGSGLLADDGLRAGFVARGGWDDDTMSRMAVLDPAETVAEDVAKLRGAAELAPTIDHVRIGGYAYDVKTGVVSTVVEPG